MKLFQGLTIAVAAVAGLGGQAHAQSVATFDVGATNFSVAIPKGYCLPTKAQDVERMRYAASLDNESITSASLVACGPNPDIADYILIKTPVGMVDQEITLTSLLGNLGPDFDKPVGADIPIPETEARIGDALSQRTGNDVKVGVAIGPRGHDDVCAYTGGTIRATNVAGGAVAIGTCVTVVQGKMFAIHVYWPGEESAVGKTLLQRARAVAVGLRGKRS